MKDCLASLAANRLAVWGVGFLLSIVLIGFQAGSSDHSQYLLPVYSALDADFCAADWFVHKTTHYNDFFVAVLVFAGKLGSVTTGLLLWQLATLGFVVLGVQLWAGRKGGSLALVLMAIALICTAIEPGWGQYVLFRKSPLPSMTAGSILFAFHAALLSRRWLTASLLWSLGVLVHPATGAVAALTVFPAVLVGLRIERPSLGTMGKALLLIMPALLIIWRIAHEFEPEGAPEIDKIFFLLRASHHYAPHMAGWDMHARSLFMLLVAGLGFSWELRSERVAVLVWLATLSAAFVLAVVCLEIVYVPFVVKLFPFRMLPLLWSLGLVSILRAMWSEQNSLSRKCIGFGVIVASLAYGYSGAAAWMIFLVVLLLGLFLERRPVAGRYWSRRVSIALIVILVLVAGDRAGDRFGWTFSTPVPGLYSEITRVVPPGETVMVPPADMRFRLYSGRAAFVEFKCFPVRRPEITEWHRRMTAQMGLDPMKFADLKMNSWTILKQLTETYRDRPVQELLSVASSEGIAWILVDKDSRFYRENPIKAVLERDGFALYYVKENDA